MIKLTVKKPEPVPVKVILEMNDEEARELFRILEPSGPCGSALAIHIRNEIFLAGLAK